jgi:hypothetical protein
MRTLKSILSVGFTSILVLVLLISCEPEKSNQITNEDALFATSENIQAAVIYKDIFQEVINTVRYAEDSINNRLKRNQFNTGSIPEISINPYDTDTWPKTVIINYGNNNSTYEDMKQRRGEIIVSLSHSITNSGASMEISFNGFYQDDFQVEGTGIVTFDGKNNQNISLFSYKLSNGLITSPDNYRYSIEHELDIEWIAGENTINPWDNEFIISGTYSGQSSNDIYFSSSIDIEKPINILNGCRWIRSGIIMIELDNFPEIKLDFGETVCDNAATANIDGEEYLINVK